MDALEILTFLVFFGGLAALIVLTTGEELISPALAAMLD